MAGWAPDRLPLAAAIPAWLLALPGSLTIVCLTFALLFTFLPPVRLPWRHVWLAVLLCTVAWIVGAEILVLFGALFGRGPTASGAVGGLFVVMLWLNKVGQLLFYGAELCKVSFSRDARGQEAPTRDPLLEDTPAGGLEQRAARSVVSADN